MKTTHKPRILFVAPLPPPVHGSSMMGKHIHDSKAINDTFRVDYVNLATSRTMDEIGKHSWPLYAHKTLHFLASYLQTLWKLLTHRYDLTYLAVTCHGTGFLKDFPYLLAARLLCKRRVIHQHNQGMAPYASRPPYKWLLPMAYAKAKVILLSWRLYDDISAVVGKDQILTCPNGLPMPPGIPGNHDTHQPPEILYLGNLVESKGVWPLLDALKTLKDKSLEFHCTFVGDTSRTITAQKFATEVRRRNLEETVEYLGPRYGSDKWQAYAKADIFVLPSTDDCLPLTIIEAMMCRLPVVASSVGAIPDLIDDGTTGFIVNHHHLMAEAGGGTATRHAALAHRLEQLLADPLLRSRMGRAGHEKYQRQFTLEAFEDNLIRCLNESMAPPNPHKKTTTK